MANNTITLPSKKTNGAAKKAAKPKGEKAAPKKPVAWKAIKVIIPVTMLAKMKTLAETAQVTHGMCLADAWDAYEKLPSKDRVDALQTRRQKEGLPVGTL